MLEKGQVVYFARILKPIGICDLLELHVRTVEEDYFVGIEKDTKAAYVFNYKDLDNIVFENRKDALAKVKSEKKNVKKDVQ